LINMMGRSMKREMNTFIGQIKRRKK